MHITKIRLARTVYATISNGEGFGHPQNHAVVAWRWLFTPLLGFTKRMWNYLAVSVALLLGAPAFAAESCSATPKKAALDLYERHQEFIFSEASSPPLSQALARAVNERLAEQLRTGDGGPIDWNYWTDAQDGEPSRKAMIVSIAGKGATANVTLAYQFLLSPTQKPLPKQALISVSRTPQGCWVIEDVRRGNRSVMSYLKLPQSTQAAQK